MGIGEGKSDIQAYYKMKQIVVLIVLLVSVSLIISCSDNSEVASQANTQTSTSASVQNGGQTNPGITPAPGAGRPILKFEPSPEDSQIAQAMQDGKLYELRIWKKHPKLLKVESTTLDEKNKSLSIVLRSAQVINITTDRIPNVRLATADQFLQLVDTAPATKVPESKAEANSGK